MRPAAYYENYWSAGGFQPLGSPTTPLQRIFRTQLIQIKNCLDVGCGDGGTIGPIARGMGVKYVGVDISRSAVDLAIQNGFEAIAIEGSDNLPFPTESFDAACLIEVLEHLFDPLETLVEVHRVLAPGGAVVITVPNIAYWRRRLDLLAFGRWNPMGDELSVREPWRDPHVRFFTPRVVERLLEKAGFQRHRVWGDHGSLCRDIPWVRKFWWRESATYGFFQRRLPSLLRYRVVAIAEKLT